MKKLFYNLFLIERSSISLSLFRIAVALTVGFYVFPTFVQFQDNYLAGAFRNYNAGLLPVHLIQLVQQSPDWLVKCFLALFIGSWFTFLVGLFSQLSCIVLLACCYYFTALNYFHLASLSWDILLVAVFMMCMTAYHGDYFSVDSLRRRRVASCLLFVVSQGVSSPSNDQRSTNNKQLTTTHKILRPYFHQRIFQLYIGFVFFFTALHKITVEGNWIKDNPIYYLMNLPIDGVMKTFILKDILYDKPGLCYAIGISIVVVEALLIFLLFWRKTRYVAIAMGIFFHLLLVLTLDVPAVFFFLFPPMLLLFINPDVIERWIDQKRQYHAERNRPKFLYDGKCSFCRRTVERLMIMDLFNRVEFVDFHSLVSDQVLDQSNPNLGIAFGLTQKQLRKASYFIVLDGKVYRGFDAFRRLTWIFPMMYPFIFVFYFPGVYCAKAFFRGVRGWGVGCRVKGLKGDLS